MAQGANVDSIDALKHFRVALFKFAEAANSALSDVESDLIRTLNWLENEQYTYWQGQIRKRHEIVERAKEAVRMKKLYKDASGRTPSAVEEEKALRLAQGRFAEAETKFANVKKYSRVLQREMQVYKGSVQRLATTVQADIPVAAAQLDQMVATLEQYVSLSTGDGATAGVAESTAPTAPPVEETDSSPSGSQS